MPIRISPSILSADFANFQSELATIATADMIHVDVMDNHFVPNLTFGLPVVARLQQISPKPLDVHLMIEDPDQWAPKYAELGAFSITFHAEASNDPVALATHLRSLGARAGIAVKPATAIEPFLDLLHNFDQILVMTVEPGFGGQALIESCLAKVSVTRASIEKNELSTWLQVDGGIDESNIERVAQAGADTFVAGSAVFKTKDRASQIALLRARAEHGFLSQQV
jgi:ribulose-phosphate 3-epimerase